MNNRDFTPLYSGYVNNTFGSGFFSKLEIQKSSNVFEAADKGMYMLKVQKGKFNNLSAKCVHTLIEKKKDLKLRIPYDKLNQIFQWVPAYDTTVMGDLNMRLEERKITDQIFVSMMHQMTNCVRVFAFIMYNHQNYIFPTEERI